VCVCAVVQNEQQTGDIVAEAEVSSHDVITTADSLHDMDVDDLLKYINGNDEKSRANAPTRKAAKRARQKQRKVTKSFGSTVSCSLWRYNSFWLFVLMGERSL